MKYPDRVQVIINSLATKHPDLVHGDDEARRKLTSFFAQQCRFELGPAWGTKRYGGGPPSADVIAYKDNTIFVGWDTQLAGGVIAQHPDSIDLSQDPEQKFIEVAPVDHLGSANPAPSPPVPDDIINRLTELQDTVDEMHAAIANVTRELAMTNSHLIRLALATKSYTGKFRLSYLGETKFNLRSE